MQLMKRPEPWDPFREMERLSTRMNDLLGLGPPAAEGEGPFLARPYPPCDVSETETEYRIRAELPHVDRKDVHVTLENDVLTIRGRREEAREQKGERMHRRELVRGEFVRRFALPEDADPARVDARLTEGVLLVTVGRTKTRPGLAKEVEIH